MRIYPTIYLITLWCSGVNADGMNDLLNLSLEELQQVKVVTVSKKSEAISDAPGVISVYTAKDIKTFGARNLKDVLLRIPNFYMFDSYAFTGTANSLRAGATQHINNHVLYLINGRPLRESQHGGRHTDINLLYPISAVERIEVIRGPGSVLYGSNAFNGAINIITKKAEPGFTAQAIASSSGEDYNTLELSSTFQSNQGASVNAQIKVLNDDGADITALDAELVPGSFNLYKKGYLARLDASYNGFSIETMASEIKHPRVNGKFSWNNLVESFNKRHYLNLGYNHQFTEDWSSALNYTLNKAFLNNQYLSNGYMLELTVNGHLYENINMVVGLVQDHVKGDLGERGGKYKDVRNSLYGQLDYRFSFGTKLTAGIQLNKPEGKNTHTSPRLALVHTFNNRWSAKALFSEAYRSPYGSELFFESSFVLGEPNLTPETIQTTEIQVSYNLPQATISTTLYNSKSNDLISRKNINGISTYVNIEQEFTYQGIELEGRWLINEKLTLQGNASYQENEDEQGNSNIMVAPNEMIKIGLSYETEFGLTTSIWNNYFGKINDATEYLNTQPVIANPEAKSVNLLTLNMEANLGELLKNANWSAVNMSLFANNILGEAVWFPELGQRSVNNYPQSHEQGIYFSLSLSY